MSVLSTSPRTRRQSQTPLLGGEANLNTTPRSRTRWTKFALVTTLALSTLSLFTPWSSVSLLTARPREGCEASGAFTPLKPQDEQRRLTVRIQPHRDSLAAPNYLPDNTLLPDAFHPALSSQIPSLFASDNSTNRPLPPPLDEDTTQTCLSPAQHSLPLLPRSVVTPDSPEIFFSVSTSPDRAVVYAPVWRHFMSKPASKAGDDDDDDDDESLSAPGCVVTDAQSRGNHAGMAKANAEFRRRGLSCTMQESSRVGERYEMRVLGLVRDAWVESERRRWQEGARLVDYFVFADDDTWFTDVAMLRDMLSAYDSREDHYFGSFSETRGTVESFGRIGFGGAGVIISRGLVRKMQSTLDRCAERFADVFGGDGIMSNCAAFTRNIPLENLVEETSSMRQMDIRGDATGYLTSGRTPFMSLHHWASWLNLIPDRNPLPTITLFSRAASILGGSNFLRRFIFDSGAVEVVLGYAVTLYRDPLQVGDLGATEHSWDGHESYLPLRRRVEQGKEKLTYYVSSIEEISPELAIFHHTCNAPTLSSSALKTFSILYDMRSGRGVERNARPVTSSPATRASSPRSSFDRKQLGQKRIFHA